MHWCFEKGESGGGAVFRGAPGERTQKTLSFFFCIFIVFMLFLVSHTAKSLGMVTFCVDFYGFVFDFQKFCGF